MTSNRTVPNCPIGWSFTKLNEVIDRLSNGTTQKQVGYGVPVTRIETISNGEINLERVGYLADVSAETVHKYGLLSGDILFSHINSDAHLGKTAIFRLPDVQLLHGMNLLLMRPNPQLVDSDYLNYLMNHYRFSGTFFGIAQHAVNQSSINQAKLNELSIPIPPLPEQHRIVAKIEELFARLDAGVDALNKVKVQLKRYRQSVLKSAFEGKLTAEWREAHKGEIEPASLLLEKIKGERAKNGKYKELPPLDTTGLHELPVGWEWTSIGQVSLIITKGSTPTSYGFKYVDNGIRFIKVENIQQGRVITKSIAEFITKDAYDFLSRSQLLENDVLCSIAGTIGRVGLVDSSDLPANINQAIAVIRCPWQFVRPAYLMHLLESPVAKDSLTRRLRGIGMNNVSLGDVRGLALPFPSLAEQDKIVEEIGLHLSAADEVERAVERTLTQSNRLRQSILGQAFEGKLAPQDPNDEPAERLLKRIEAEKGRQQTVARTTRGIANRRRNQGRLG